MKKHKIITTVTCLFITALLAACGVASGETAGSSDSYVKPVSESSESVSEISAEPVESAESVTETSEGSEELLSVSAVSVDEPSTTPVPTAAAEDTSAANDEEGAENTADEEEENTEEADSVEEQKTIAIDPGHQGPGVDMSATEPNGPGSSVMKAKATSGTSGVSTGVGEYELNLNISMQLQTELENRGYNVVLTRTSNDEAISNAERAQLANQSGADVYLRIHANGSEDSSASGALALTSTADNPWVGSFYDESYRLATDVLNAYCEQTGFTNLGIQTTDTMTGINWAQEPVMILEMGFMTNPEEDVTMEDPAFQTKMVTGIANGVDQYFEESQGLN